MSLFRQNRQVLNKKKHNNKRLNVLCPSRRRRYQSPGKIWHASTLRSIFGSGTSTPGTRTRAFRRPRSSTCPWSATATGRTGTRSVGRCTSWIPCVGAGACGSYFIATTESTGRAPCTWPGVSGTEPAWLRPNGNGFVSDRPYPVYKSCLSAKRHSAARMVKPSTIVMSCSGDRRGVIHCSATSRWTQ